MLPAALARLQLGWRHIDDVTVRDQKFDLPHLGIVVIAEVLAAMDSQLLGHRVLEGLAEIHLILSRDDRLHVCG